MSDQATEKNLTPAQRKAIEGLLTSGSTTDAAASANVNRSTLYRWMRDPAFVQGLRDAEQEAVAGLSRTLAGLGELAGAALRDALHEDQKITVRVRAAEVVTDRLLRLRELVELERRLVALEAKANEQAN